MTSVHRWGRVVFVEAWAVDVAGWQLASAVPQYTGLALFVVGVVVGTAGFIVGDQRADRDLTWLLWELCAWVLMGVAFPLLFGGTAVWYVVVFWYLVVSVGCALVGAVLWGLELLVDVAEDFPLAFGLGGAGVGLVCVGGAVVFAVAGRPWLALAVLAIATVSVGMASLLALESSELTPRQEAVVAGVGLRVAMVGGLALLVLGPLAAFTIPGEVFERVLRGGVLAGVGGALCWFPSQASLAYQQGRG